MADYRASLGRLHAAFSFGSEHKGVACVKAALAEEGLLSSSRLAPGTTPLSAEEKERWMRDYQGIKAELGLLGGGHSSLPGQAPEAPSVTVSGPLDSAAAGHLRVALSELGTWPKAIPWPNCARPAG